MEFKIVLVMVFLGLVFVTYDRIIRQIKDAFYL